MPLLYNGKMIPLAKSLRKNATKQENHLWYDFLREYPVRFQRQKTIGTYITDFYCFEAKLVIELDGSQHYEGNGIEYDRKRTEFLESKGLTVVRIQNCDINRNFEGVCIYIDQQVKSKLSK